VTEDVAARALVVLQEQRGALAPGLSADLVEKIYRIEERVQFDAGRPEAPSRIREIVQPFVELTTQERGGTDADKS